MYLTKLLSDSWKRTIFFIISFMLLFLSFQYNIFSTVNQTRFEKFQYDSEVLVIGRLVESRKNSVSSYGGQLGFVSVDNLHYGDKGFFEAATNTYLDPTIDFEFIPYGSQIGIQGIFYSEIDKLLNFFNVSGYEKYLDYYHSIASIILALTLSILLVLLCFEIGVAPSCIVLVSMLFSEWLVLFGRNLYWMIGLMFIPMTITWLLHKWEESKNRFNMKLAASLVLVSFFLKSASGYEYLSTIFIAMLTPIVYFAIKNKWRFKKFLNRLFLLGLAGVMGFIIAFFVQIYQTGIAQELTFRESLEAQVHHAVSRLDAKEGSFAEGTRWALAPNASRLEVLNIYLNGKAIDLREVFGWKYFKVVSYFDLIYIFLIFSMLGVIYNQHSRSIEKNRRVVSALIWGTWFSLLAPLSWYLLAKIHSYVHTHLNNLLWQIPFTVFGFALLGFICSLFIREAVASANKKYFYLMLLSIVAMCVTNYYVNSEANQNLVTSVLKKKRLVDLVTTGNINLIITNDGELVYYIPDCDSKQVQGRFFLHITPASQNDLKSKKYTYNNYDFSWEEYKVHNSWISAYSGSCIAVRELPKYNIQTIDTGRYNRSHNGAIIFWHEKLGLKLMIKKAESITAVDLSDTRWKNGVSRNKASFFVVNSLINRISLTGETILDFPFSGEREITEIIVTSKYINVDVKGGELDPIKDGYPNKINILKGDIK